MFQPAKKFKICKCVCRIEKAIKQSSNNSGSKESGPPKLSVWLARCPWAPASWSSAWQQRKTIKNRQLVKSWQAHKHTLRQLRQHVNASTAKLTCIVLAWRRSGRYLAAMRETCTNVVTKLNMASIKHTEAGQHRFHKVSIKCVQGLFPRWAKATRPYTDNHTYSHIETAKHCVQVRHGQTWLQHTQTSLLQSIRFYQKNHKSKTYKTSMFNQCHQVPSLEPKSVFLEFVAGNSWLTCAGSGRVWGELLLLCCDSTSMIPAAKL